MSFKTAQTFYVDPAAVANTPQCFLTSVSLSFQAVPKAKGNASGIRNPGVTVAICPTVGGVPDPTQAIALSQTSLDLPDIPADANLASQSTKFTFPQPVPVRSGTSYAILVAPEDPGFVLWTAKAGENYVGSTAAFSGPSGFQGSLFDASSDGTWKPVSGSSLKFSVGIASFTANTFSFEMTPRAHEFLTVQSQTGPFTGGEFVFAQSANVPGTVSLTKDSTSVIGTGTDFTARYQAGAGAAFAVNSTVYHVTTVASVSNDTVMVLEDPSPATNTASLAYRTPVAHVFSQDVPKGKLRLVDSTANSTVRFQAGQTLQGSISAQTCVVTSVDAVPVTSLDPNLLTYVPSTGVMDLTYAFAEVSGNTYAMASELPLQNDTEVVPTYDALILSRSLEAINANGMHGGVKSAYLKAVASVNRQNGQVYDSPYVWDEKIDLFAGSWSVNDDDTGETGPQGSALARHVTVPLTFAAGAQAEDLIVYSTAYRPATTSVEAYARIHNSRDPFSLDDKAWTKLVAVDDTDQQYSQSSDSTVEFQWEIPSATDLVAATTANGVVTVSSGNSVLVGFGSSFTSDLSVGSLVRVRNPIFPADCFVCSVLSVANDDHCTVDFATSNSSVLGSGFLVDVLAEPLGAFLNPQNNGVVRYYDEDGTPYDAYDSTQVKVLLLSESVRVVPKLKDLRAVGCSA